MRTFVAAERSANILIHGLALEHAKAQLHSKVRYDSDEEDGVLPSIGECSVLSPAADVRHHLGVRPGSWS